MEGLVGGGWGVSGGPCKRETYKWGGLVNVDVTIIFVGLKEKLQCNVYSPTLPLVDKKKVHFPLSS